MKTLFKSILIIISLSFASSVFAVCNVHGKVDRIYARSSGTTDYAYYYLHPKTSSTTQTYYYYVYTADDDDRLNDLLSAAFASGKSVFVQGNRSTCGTGTGRYMGSAVYGYAYDRN
ncbi:MAG: hypothetical protein GQ532_14870 [Methylomarinum sp.]|nr:hypothetical protein [Methylomarinum sp.]